MAFSEPYRHVLIRKSYVVEGLYCAQDGRNGTSLGDVKLKIEFGSQMMNPNPNLSAPFTLHVVLTTGDLAAANASMASVNRHFLSSAFTRGLPSQWIRSVVIGSWRSYSAPARRQQSLKHLIKPFLLRCHPDVQQSDEAKKLNLVAIQNLNSYVDRVSDALKSGTLPRPSQGSNVVVIDFIIQVEGPAGQRKKAPSSFPSRRQVELALPTMLRRNDSTGLKGPEAAAAFHRKAARELAKLLRVAALPMPKMDGAISDDDLHFDDEVDDDDGYVSRPHHLRVDPMQSSFTSSSRRSRYEARRDRFVASINWKAYDKVYRAAVADMQADRMTSGLVRNHVGRRRRLIANVLSRAEFDEDIGTTDQLVAFRRLSLLLDEHFDGLQLEDLGAYWESCRLQLSSDRDFAFTLHADSTVTIRIPIDFTDEQLIRELDRNLWDFVDVAEEDAFSEVFPGR